jgi:hypothetical protein
MEALRFDHAKAGGDKNPRAENDPFWRRFRERWRTPADFKETERLCAVAMVKRLAGYVTIAMDNHPLHPFFARPKGFPSTTEIGLTDWFSMLEQTVPEARRELGENWKTQIAQYVHEAEAETQEEREGFEVGQISENERQVCRRVIREAERKGAKILDRTATTPSCSWMETK